MDCNHVVGAFKAIAIATAVAIHINALRGAPSWPVQCARSVYFQW